MSQMWFLGAIVCLFGLTYAGEVCYDGLGCFSDLPPWGGTKERPLPRLPWVPERMGTRFLLFTQKNKYYHEITADPKIMKVTNYNSYRATTFIIPGYLEQKDEDWAQDMCRDILKWDSVNCIAMEWKAGVKTPYAQAANNARVVAAQVAHMITFLMSNYTQTAGKFHIIGHSLGAHAAGEVGRLIPNLARITGLDPVEPYFQGVHRTVRLDTGDAAFVDVIHTDGLPFTKNNLGLGMAEPMGHIDFYPNGGELMPGCGKNRGSPSDLDAIWQGTKDFDGCNHARAHQYYSESALKAAGFMGYPCSDQDSFDAGMCFPCAGDSCPLMGHSAKKFNVTSVPLGSKYFLTTGKKKPFGRFSYSAKVLMEGSSFPNPGFMFLTLKGDRDETEKFQLHAGMLSPGIYDLLINSEKDVGEIKGMTFQWNNHIFNPIRPKYSASKIELVRGKDKKTYNFCGVDKVGENDIQAVLPCKV